MRTRHLALDAANNTVLSPNLQVQRAQPSYDLLQSSSGNFLTLPRIEVKQFSLVLPGLAHGTFPVPSLEAFCQGSNTLPHHEVS
jgi:hypothetical protein